MKSSIEHLLDRYLEGKTSIEENERIEAWLHNKHLAHSEWQQMDPLNKERWLSDVYLDIKDSIVKMELKTDTMKSQRHLWYKISGAAAVFIIMLTLFFIWHSPENKVSISSVASISTKATKKQKITLSDGTTVWLNSASELKYPEVFKDHSRAVYLSGEAYFDVRHDPSRPFIIHTGSVITTVLGTAFNIKENKNQHTIDVTVLRGKVSVASEGKLISIVTPNQQLSLDVVTGVPIKSTVNTDKIISWQAEDLEFNDITLATAVIKLQRHFNVLIILDNQKLNDCRFSGRALEGDKLDDILDAITSLNGASWKKNAKGHIRIYGKGCN